MWYGSPRESQQKANFWSKRGRGRCMELGEVKFSAKKKTKQTKGELSPHILCLGGVKYWASPVAQWERTDFFGKIADIDQFHLNIYVLVNRKPPKELMISYGINPVSLMPSTSWRTFVCLRSFETSGWVHVGFSLTLAGSRSSLPWILRLHCLTSHVRPRGKSMFIHNWTPQRRAVSEAINRVWEVLC